VLAVSDQKWPAYDQGTGRRNRCDGEHGHAWPGAYRGLGQPFRQALDRCIGLCREAVKRITGINVEQVGSTDAEQFAQRKIPRITIHSLTQETWNARIIHTSKDKISARRLDDYYQTYRLLATYVASLDQLASEPMPPTMH
jgi:hypothetical protein